MVVAFYQQLNAQIATISQHNFNGSGSAYPFPADLTASNVTASLTSTEGFIEYEGIASGSQAFTSNTTAGNGIAFANSSGTNTRYWTLTMGGSALANYKSYKLYVQAQRSSTGATTLTLQYSINGTTFTNFGTTMTPGNGTYSEQVFDLTSITALDLRTAVYFRLAASGASGTGTLRIDNLEIQANLTSGSGGSGGGSGWALTGNAGTTPATNFIGTTDAQDFIIKSNGVERMRMTSAGNIGIGTATPAYSLDIAGNLNSSGTISANILTVNQSLSVDTLLPRKRILVNGGLSLRGTSSAKGVNAIDVYNTDLWINSSGVSTNLNTIINAASTGFVGIGLLSPRYKLDVAGDINTSGILHVGTGVVVAGSIAANSLTLSSSFTADTIFPRKRILVNGGLSLQGNGTVAGVNAIDAGTSDLMINSLGLSNNHNIILNASSTGFVGIGTTTPAATLDVQGNINTSGTMTVGVLAPTNKAGVLIQANASSGIALGVQGVLHSFGNVQIDSNLVLNGNLTTNGTMNVGTLSSPYKNGVNILPNPLTGVSLSVLGVLHSYGNVLVDSSLTIGGAFQTKGPLNVGTDLTTQGNATIATLANTSGYSYVVADASGKLFPLSFGPGHPLPPNFTAPNCLPWLACGNDFAPTDSPFLGTNSNNNLILGAGGNNVMSLTLNGNVIAGGGGLSLGSAEGPALNFGNGYVGFNASRDVNSGTWTTAGGGGSAIWSNNAGHMYFSSIPAASAPGNSFTDAAAMSGVAMSIIPQGGGTTFFNMNSTAETKLNINTSGAAPSSVWTTNSAYGFGFGVDAAGLGHIYSGTNTPPSMTFDNAGNVSIGTASTSSNGISYLLSVKGLMHSIEILVEPVWADYVFEKNYKLRSLQEVNAFIDKNGHLPEVPSAEEVKNNGVKLGEMDAILLKKIEELTLYMIEQNKKIEMLEKQLKER